MGTGRVSHPLDDIQGFVRVSWGHRTPQSSLTSLAWSLLERLCPSHLYNADGSPKAVVSTLTADSGWLSNEMLKQLMQGEMASRDASKAFEVDATIYSNNSVFGIFPARDAPGSDGRLRVNGSLVAADIGLLSPTSLQLNYDGRGGSLLDIRADSEVQIRRQARVPVRP